MEATPTPPHSASIASMAQRVKGRNAVNHDHRTVPDTLAGMSYIDSRIDIKIIELSTYCLIQI